MTHSAMPAGPKGVPARPFASIAPGASPLSGIAPGPPEVVYSSAALRCQGFLVEKHVCSPGQRVATSTDYHLISILHGRPARFEYGTRGDNHRLFTDSGGDLTIMPAGKVPAVTLHTPAELTHCALEDSFTRRVVDEMEPRPANRAVFRTGLRDTSMQRILDLLVQELEADAPTGRLYAESLAHALATRYLLSGSDCGEKAKSSISALPHRILNRVREKIESNVHMDVSLESLAEESGYSRAHFLRMFHAATGVTPHQYVLEVRLRRAQEWLRQKNSTLIDVAALCGFSSQSHMTSVFRKRLGVTPGEFRRCGC